jgi:hypothetical protein
MISTPHALSSRSQLTVNVSMAALLPVELKSEPAHLLGQASKKFQRIFS